MIREQLVVLSFDELLALCDSLSLSHPANKEDAIELLLGNCPDCPKGGITVVYKKGTKKTTVTPDAKPCIGCNK